MIIIIIWEKMRYSRQRALILQALRQNPVHPTAEELYALIKPLEPNISLATVYRNLNLLAAQDLILKFGSLSGTARFDYCTDEHYHFICTNCGKVFDLPAKVASHLLQQASAQSGFDIRSCDLLFQGLCPQCNNRNTN